MYGPYSGSGFYMIRVDCGSGLNLNGIAFPANLVPYEIDPGDNLDDQTRYGLNFTEVKLAQNSSF